MGEVIVVDGQLFAAQRCRHCGAKIYPAELLQRHEERHQDDGWRICPAGHSYLAYEMGERKLCGQCYGAARRRGQRRTGNKGGRPESGGWRARAKLKLLKV